MEFWYIQAEKLRLGRKRNNLLEVRLAMHGKASEITDELYQIKWGLKSLDMDRSKMPKGVK